MIHATCTKRTCTLVDTRNTRKSESRVGEARQARTKRGWRPQGVEETRRWQPETLVAPLLLSTKSLGNHLVGEAAVFVTGD
jgi:hypothetical protein